MTNQKMVELVEQAVEKAWDQWALEHPSLAEAINASGIREQVAVTIRDSQAFKDALEHYKQSGNQLGLLAQVIELAKPLIASLLG